MALPETEPASEFVCGEVIQKPMPDNPHGALQPYIWMLIYTFITPRRLGRVRTEWRCIFGRPGAVRGYVPDVVSASFQTMPPGDARDMRVLFAAPDLAVEVLSPGQNADRFAQKITHYRDNGVGLIWVLNPDEERITVYPRGQEPVELRPGDTLTGGDVLPGFTASVADIFAQLIS